MGAPAVAPCHVGSGSSGQRVKEMDEPRGSGLPRSHIVSVASLIFYLMANAPHGGVPA